MSQINWKFICLLFCSVKVFLIKVILNYLGSNIITYSCWVFQNCSFIWSLKLEQNSRLSTGMLFTVTKNILVFPSGAQVRPQAFDITFIYFSVAFDVGSYICSDFCHSLPFCDTSLSVQSLKCLSLDITSPLLSKSLPNVHGNQISFFTLSPLLFYHLVGDISCAIFMTVTTITSPQICFFHFDSAYFVEHLLEFSLNIMYEYRSSSIPLKLSSSFDKIKRRYSEHRIIMGPWANVKCSLHL